VPRQWRSAANGHGNAAFEELPYRTEAKLDAQEKDFLIKCYSSPPLLLSESALSQTFINPVSMRHHAIR
jgi:hypothetical protein